MGAEEQMLKMVRDSMDRMERNTQASLKEIKRDLAANTRDTQAIKTYISNQKTMFWTGGSLVVAMAGVVTWLTNVFSFFGGHGGKVP